jgi:Putative restriction endonuclease
MADVAEKRMTVAEFLTWDDGTDTRYELLDGRPVPMAPVTASHSIIVAERAGNGGEHPGRAAAPAGFQLGNVSPAHARRLRQLLLRHAPIVAPHPDRVRPGEQRIGHRDRHALLSRCTFARS